MQQAFYCLGREINADAAKDDGGAAGHVEPPADAEPGDGGEEGDEGGGPYQTVVAAHEEGGGELGHAEQGNDHDDAHQVEAGHDGEGGEQGEEGFDGAHGQALGEGEVAVAGYGADGAAQQEIEEGDDGAEHADGAERGGVDAEDVAEEVGREVRHEAGGEPGEEYAQRHAAGPEHGDGGILADVAPPREVLEDEAGGHGETGCAPQGRKAHPGSETHAAEGGVRHAAAHDDEAARDDVSAYHRTEHGGKQCAEQRVLEKGVFERHGLGDRGL